MDADPLLDHFVAATRQDPCPYGEDAVEWDYSRYARALGLTDRPGLHELKHTGAALVGVPTSCWDGIARRYREASEAAGWRFVRVSARASVLVPDAAVHGLGIAVSGLDSMVFARSGRGGRPALGSRPRSPGMSLPLTTGERWLIATDRVRRRLRSEVASQGLCVVIEEAHKLTAAGMNLVGHMLDAHRAWKARMLSRGARAYFVLLTTPGRYASVLAMLERYSLTGEIHCMCETEPIVGPDSAPAPYIAAEEEHLLAALAAAPLALAEKDVAAVFGRSAVATARDLAGRGLLRRRPEEGSVSYAVAPAVMDALPAPPVRVLRELFARYRFRARAGRGHGHLHAAAAALAFRLGEPKRALACLGRMGHGDNATLALDLLEELDARLAALAMEVESSSVPDSLAGSDPGRRKSPPLRAGTIAGWLAWHAHERAYDRAKELARKLGQVPVRGERDLYKTLTHILCTGRTHLDQALPDGFWATLTASNVEPSLLEALCILADLFARIRLMSDKEILDRFEVVEGVLGGGGPHSASATDQGAARCRRRIVSCIACLLRRAHSHVVAHITQRSGALAAPHINSKFDPYQDPVPAYVVASSAYSELLEGVRTEGPLSRVRSLAMVRDLVVSTGNVRDGHPQTGCLLQFLVLKGLRLLVRSLADDIVLLIDPNAPHTIRRRVSSTLQCMATSRASLVSAHRLFLKQHLALNHSTLHPQSAAALAFMLVEGGDFAGAKDAIRLGDAYRPTHSGDVGVLLFCKILLARRLLDDATLVALSAETESSVDSLSPALTAFLSNFARASHALLQRDFTAARMLYWRAQRALRHSSFGIYGTMRREAIHSALRATACSAPHASLTLRGSGGATRSHVAAVMDAALGVPGAGISHCHADGYNLSSDLEWVVLAIERAACWGGRAAAQAIVEWAVRIRSHADLRLRSVGLSCTSVLEKWAPCAMKLVTEALRSKAGVLMPSGPIQRALDSAAIALGALHPPTPIGFLLASARRRHPHVPRAALEQSHRRRTRLAHAHWPHDATLYAVTLSAVRRAVETATTNEGGIAISSWGYANETTLRLVCRIVPTSTSSAHWTVELERHPPQIPRHASHLTRHPPIEASRVAHNACPRGPNNSACLAFLGSSPAAKQIRELVAVASDCTYPVLLIGETGTGKDLLARMIHKARHRDGCEMVVLDPSVCVESMLESILFGHERGAFSGAVCRHRGLLAQAHQSTLFLDEVNDLPSRVQCALLRVLESGEYRPIGCSRVHQSNFGLISAASVPLDELVVSGHVRQDFFYRISTITIEIPPLRARAQDSLDIAEQACRDAGASLHGDAREFVMHAEWPGNVRQLQNVIRVAAAFSRSGKVQGETLRSTYSAMSNKRLTESDRSGRTPSGTYGGARQVAEDLSARGDFRLADFAAAAGMSRRSAQRYLARMCSKGAVTRKGAGRATRYGSGSPHS